MMDIERISEKIREEKDNLVAKAFACQIAELLQKNGIVPIMMERTDLERIYEKDEYLLVDKYGISFDILDTREHDAKVRAEVVDEVIKALNESMPLVKNGDIICGFLCAIQRVEQLKEKNK